MEINLSSELSNHDLINRFGYHAPPDEETARRHELVRDACHSAAQRLRVIMPPGREASLAVTKLEEAMFWANAAVARVNPVSTRARQEGA